MQETTFTPNRRKAKIIKRNATQITDGLVVAPSAGIEIDPSLMTDYEYFYVQRALLKGAIKVVQYEVFSEDKEILV